MERTRLATVSGGSADALAFSWLCCSISDKHLQTSIGLHNSSTGRVWELWGSPAGPEKSPKSSKSRNKALKEASGRAIDLEVLPCTSPRGEPTQVPVPLVEPAASSGEATASANLEPTPESPPSGLPQDEGLPWPWVRVPFEDSASGTGGVGVPHIRWGLGPSNS